MKTKRQRLFWRFWTFFQKRLLQIRHFNHFLTFFNTRTSIVKMPKEVTFSSTCYTKHSIKVLTPIKTIKVKTGVSCTVIIPVHTMAGLKLNWICFGDVTPPMAKLK